MARAAPAPRTEHKTHAYGVISIHHSPPLLFTMPWEVPWLSFFMAWYQVQLADVGICCSILQ